MRACVALQRRRRIDAHDFAVGILPRLGRKVRIQAQEGLAQSAFQHDIAVVRIAALGAGLGGGDVRTVQDHVAETLQPGECRFLDDGLGKPSHAEAPASMLTL